MAIAEMRYSHLSEASEDSPNYLYSLICDYERYIKDFQEPISIATFLQQWQCIPREGFEKLTPGDIVYDSNGSALRIFDLPYETEDEANLVVEVEYINKGVGSNNYTCSMYTGDLYYTQYIHGEYNWKKKKIKESEGKPCPILITKTNRPQS